MQKAEFVILKQLFSSDLVEKFKFLGIYMREFLRQCSDSLTNIFSSDKIHRAKPEIPQKFVRNCGWTNDVTARYNQIIGIYPIAHNKTKGDDKMLTYEQQTEKLLNKRKALEDRIREDSAEIEKINAKLNELQLAKVRDTFGLSQKEFFELITKHPEKLLELVQNGAAQSDIETALDGAETVGQTSFFNKKSNHYSD